MKKSLASLIFFLAALSGFSQNWNTISSGVPEAGNVRVVSSTIERSVVHFSLPGFFLREVVTPQGKAFAVEVGNATPILDAGAPDLPKFTASLVIPDEAGMDIRIVSSSYRDYPNIVIAPSRGVITRDVDPSTVPYTFGNVYSRDDFYPGALAGTREPYIIRNVRGQTLVANPFQYNPVSKVLRVYYDLTVELYKISDAGSNPLHNAPGIKTITQDYQSVYQHHFMNFDALNSVPLNEYGNLLVICYGPFMEAMQPYVKWKTAEGYQTELISKDSVGTTAAQIKSFISAYYSTKGLTHVLLVGDGAQVPTNNGSGLGGPSDNAYGYIIGMDHYADVFIGRFSAENIAQVQTQVQRTLEYEKNPQFLEEEWLTTVIGIGSDQGPGDDNEFDYQHIRNQQAQLLAYNYTMNPELFDGSQGGNDAAGNPTPPMVATEVNNGAGLILYTGHGSNTSWGTSNFSNNNVNQLTNVGKLPFIWSVACVNGNFTAGTCFAEAWLRASQGGEPTGAIAFLGSTINQSWDSPMEGQDQMTNILSEADSNNIKRTFAGISINGCMKMIDSYGLDGSNMADTWTVFGDPTIMVRTAVPQAITAVYDTMLFVSDSVMPVYCNVNGARVTASMADKILATGLVVNDTAMLVFQPLSAAQETIHLVITAYNMLPYEDTLFVHAIPAPVVAGFIGVPAQVVPGHSVAFADTTTGNATTWQWSFPGGIPDVSNEQNPVISYNTVGIYDVKLVAGNGFTTDSVLTTGYIVVDFPAATGEMTESFQCTLLPNPCNGTFTLNVTPARADQLSLMVYDMIGTTVYSENISFAGQWSKTMHLASLPDGIYFVKIGGKTGMVTRKLVIRK